MHLFQLFKYKMLYKYIDNLEKLQLRIDNNHENFHILYTLLKIKSKTENNACYKEM